MAFIRSRSSLYRAKGISPSNAKIFSEGWKSVAQLSVLARCSGGDREAFESLVRLVYDDLRRIAHRRLQSERTDITLDTTAVVHEAYLALVDQATATWNDRAHFLAVAARVIKFLDPGEEDVLHHTRTGIQPLTLEYASPEQVLGQPVTTASDVYQLGTPLFGLLTGSFPLETGDGSRWSLQEAIVRSPPRKLSDVTARATAVRDYLTEIFEAAPTLGGDANGDLGYVSVRRTVDRVSKHVIERTPSSCQAALADADRLLEQMRRSGTTQGAWQEDGCPGT